MCLWASGDRGQDEPRHNGNEQTGCHPIFGRDSVVRPDRQDHHLIDGLKDPTARIATLPVVAPRDRTEGTPARLHISCFPPAHLHGRFTPDSWRATAGYCDGTPNIEFATEERGHEGVPCVAANFWIRTFILRPSGVSEPNEPDCRIDMHRCGVATLSMRRVGPTRAS